MTNHQTGHRTVIKVAHWEAGVALPDEQFTARYIERE
jgi:hypothetical protein